MTVGPAIRLSANERWLGTAVPVGRVSRAMGLVAGASLLGHLAIVGTVAVAGRSDVAPPTEIAVEIVHEVPKPEVPKPAAPEPAKPEKQARIEAAKPEPAKPEPAKPEPAKVEPAKPAPKPVASKPVASKPDPVKPGVTKVARSEPPAHPATKAEHKVAVAPKPPPARTEAAAESKLAELQRELESLKAEQAQLQSQHDAADLAPTPAALRDTGLGLLPNSFQAVALPSTTDGPGEAASYEAIVFSALAKAKGIGPRQGLPGTAGVRFSVDAAGKLVAVELIQWSGVPSLDEEALALVRRAAFPPPPQGAQRTFVANVNFETRNR